MTAAAYGPRGDLLSQLFGTGHAAWAPSTFTAVLGGSQGSGPATGGTGPALQLYSASTTVPNDSTHWSSGTNETTITFSALTSGDIAVWDDIALTVTLEDGSGNQICCAALFDINSSIHLGTPYFLVYPFVGLIISVGPGVLAFQ